MYKFNLYDCLNMKGKIMFCSKCGKEINDEAVICVYCGCAVNDNVIANGRDWLTAMLLCWFLGGFGVHRFYCGYIGSGIVQLLTLGGCGIWSFIDWISLCFNGFRDIDNKPLKNYKRNLGIVFFVIGFIITALAFMAFMAVGDIE